MSFNQNSLSIAHILCSFALNNIFYSKSYGQHYLKYFFFFFKTTDGQFLIADNMTRYDDHNNEAKGNVRRKKAIGFRLMVLLTKFSLYYVITYH